MPRKTTEEKLQAIHHDAMVEFDSIQSALRDERRQCLQDRRFYSLAGSQWEGPLGDQFENKPRLEVNKVHLAVIRIFNEYRNNRIDVEFTAKDGATDTALAGACAALYRSDEQDSSAEEAYDNAFEEAVGGGFGAWRLRAKYEDEENEDEDGRQRVQIEPIVDADSSVFFDLNAKRQDKSDARTCYVLTSMTRSEYKRQYPDDDPSSWVKLIHQYEFDWLTPDVVYLAEYYAVEMTSEVIHSFKGLDGQEVSRTDEELEDNEGLATELKATGFKQTGEKKTKRKRIHKYLLNGRGVLEDSGYIVGREIPIVPVYGKRWFIDNVERCMGHVRLAKDSQRIKNMQLSKLAEISALSSVEKPIFMPEQVAGHQVMWAEDNIKNYPYMLLNPVMDAAGQQAISGPIGRTQVANVPPSMAALLQLTDQDMEQILGNPQQAEKIVSHVAGKTVEAIQQRIDGNAFIYISNMGKAIRRCGQIWLSMARDLYTEPGRKMKGVGDRGELTQLEIRKPVLDSEGRVSKANDLSRASFDVAVNIGPSSVSKREAAVRTITNMMAVTQDPETQAILSTYALSQMEGEGVEDLRAWCRQKLVKAGVFKATPEEQKQMELEAKNAKPNPNDEYLRAAAAAEQAKAQVSIADQALIAARVEKTKADTIETLSGISIDKQKAALDEMKTLSDIHLDHKASAVGTAESLHGMMNTPSPAAPSGQNPSGDPGGLGSA